MRTVFFAIYNITTIIMSFFKNFALLFSLLIFYLFLTADTSFAKPLCADYGYTEPKTRIEATCNYERETCTTSSYTFSGYCDSKVKTGEGWYYCGFCAKPSERCNTSRINNPEGPGTIWICNTPFTNKEASGVCAGSHFYTCEAFQQPPTCSNPNPSCTNRCGQISKGAQPQCGYKDCGRCANGYRCNSNNRCEQINTCDPFPSNQSQCGNNYLCGVQNNGCGGTFNCGNNCNNGYSCKGQNSQGRNGTCRKDPTPTPPRPTNEPPPPPPNNNVIGMVFYDRYGVSGNPKGSEPTYNNCYPATNTSGSGANRAQATLTIENSTGSSSNTYTPWSYKNCTRNGSSGSGKGFVLSSNLRCKSVRLNVPSGYRSTGYNYSIGSGGTTVVTNGQLNRTPVLCGNATVRFGLERVTPPSNTVGGMVYIDDNGNNLYEPGEEADDGNNEICYNGNVNINIGGTNHTFASKTSCNTTFNLNKAPEESYTRIVLFACVPPQ